MQSACSTLLYIEDNAANCRLVERLLEQRPSLQLIIAMTGILGVMRAISMRPAIIILDLDLPDISGEEVLRQLRAHPTTDQIPVILFTADSDLDRIDQLLRIGAHSYLPKPLFPLQRMLERIDSILAASAPLCAGRTAAP